MSCPRLLRALAALSLLSAVACGGAIAPDGSSSGGSSSSGSSPTPTPTPPGTATPTPPSTSTSTPGQPPPPPGTPTWASTALGCGNFEIYFPDTTNQKFILVQADKQQLGIAQVGDTATVDLASTSAASVLLDTYAAPAFEPPYCNDVASSSPTGEARAVSGTVTFTISGNANDLYQVDVTLRNVLVGDTNGGYLFLPDLTFKGVTVGWFAG